jgi:hypothetical protein
MEVPEEVLQLVEEAEGAKAHGNTKFKGSEYSAASLEYKHGCSLVDRALKHGVADPDPNPNPNPDPDPDPDPDPNPHPDPNLTLTLKHGVANPNPLTLTLALWL